MPILAQDHIHTNTNTRAENNDEKPQKYSEKLSVIVDLNVKINNILLIILQHC